MKTALRTSLQVACVAGLVLVIAGAGSESLSSNETGLSHLEQGSSAPPTHVLQARWQQPGGAALSAADADDLYQEKCSLCHGADRTGKPPVFPTLIGVTSKYSDAEITKQIRNGKGRMPAYPSLAPEEVAAIISVLHKSQNAPGTPESAPPATAPPSIAMLVAMPVR